MKFKVTGMIGVHRMEETCRAAIAYALIEAKDLDRTLHICEFVNGRWMAIIDVEPSGALFAVFEP